MCCYTPIFTDIDFGAADKYNKKGKIDVCVSQSYTKWPGAQSVAISLDRYSLVE